MVITALAMKFIGAVGGALRHTPLVRWAWLGKLHAGIVWKLRGKRDSFQVGEFKVFVDPRDRVIASRLALYGGFEQREISLLCSLVTTGDCVLDIGANIGLYALALSRAVGPLGRVIAVEPDKDNHDLLSRNLEVNGCTNVTIVNEAMGDRDGTVNLYQTDENRGALSTSDILGVGEERATKVRMRRGDAILAELGARPRIAKIDVEGAEPSVMQGLGDHLPPILLFEMVPWQLRAAGHDPLGMLQWLDAQGYRLDLVDPDTGGHRTYAPEALLAEIESIRGDRNVLARRDLPA